MDTKKGLLNDLMITFFGDLHISKRQIATYHILKNLELQHLNRRMVDIISWWKMKTFIKNL